MQISRLGLTHASVFKKCLVLMAGATILVATVLSALNIQTKNAASTGASVLWPRLRLPQPRRPAGRPCALEMSPHWRRPGARTRHGRRRGPARRGGQCSGRDPGRPRAAEEDATSTLQALAQAAMRSGEVQISPDGFLRAVPSFAGSDTTSAVGAVAIIWTPASAVPPPGPTDRQPCRIRPVLVACFLAPDGSCAGSCRSPVRCWPRKS
jgi:hypothetical protein